MNDVPPLVRETAPPLLLVLLAGLAVACGNRAAVPSPEAGDGIPTIGVTTVTAGTMTPVPADATPMPTIDPATALGKCEELEPASYGGVEAEREAVFATAQAALEDNELLDELESAYAAGSRPGRDAYLQAWSEALSANEPDESQPRVVREAYALYEAFYRPDDLSRVGGSERGDDLYSSADYAIVQNSLPVLCTPQLAQTPGDMFQMPPPEAISREGLIEDFRPDVAPGHLTPLYLDQEHEIALRAFLGSGSLGTLAGAAAQTTPAAGGDSQAREEFLGPAVKVIRSHFGDHWHLLTHPEAQALIFNSDLTEARILFRTGYEGGFAGAERTEEGWTIVRSERTWIE